METPREEAMTVGQLLLQSSVGKILEARELVRILGAGLARAWFNPSSI